MPVVDAYSESGWPLDLGAPDPDGGGPFCDNGAEGLDQ